MVREGRRWGDSHSQSGEPQGMTSECFTSWLGAMRTAKIAPTQAECARLLGISRQHVTRMKKEGTSSRVMALACRALLHRLGPYQEVVS